MHDEGISVVHHRPPLFGRRREVAFLREWLLTSASMSPSQSGTSAAGSTSLLLLGGGRGIGKGALAESLFLLPSVATTDAISAARETDVFVSGRFHPARAETGRRPPPDRPLSAFWDALNNLFHMNHLTEANSIQTAILSEFREADDVETLMEMMPASKQWLAGRRGRTATDLSLESAPTRPGPQYLINKRMLNTGPVTFAVRFVRAVSRCEISSLVVCMEHLEYADSATFELIDNLLSDTTTTGGFLHLIATCRDDTEPSPALEQLLNRAMEATMDGVGARNVMSQQIVKVRVGNLSWEDTYKWTLYTFGRETLSEDMLQSIVDLVHERSFGNPQFAVCLLSFVAGHIQACTLNERSVEVLRASTPECVDKLYALAVRQLKHGVSSVVELVAVLGECQGGEALEVATLDLVMRRPCSDHVFSAQQSGIFDPSTRAGLVRFPCSEFQRVAYSMISEARRLALHLKIGRRLWKPSSSGLPQDVVDEGLSSSMFLGAYNLQRGMELVTDTSELNTIVNISINAGKRAMESSRFPLAAGYFELAISALGDRLWNTQCYDVSLALFNGVSEAYYCSADFDSVQRSLDVVLREATTFQDKLQAYSTLVYAHGAQHRLEDAMSLAAHVLHQVGDSIPSNPSNYQVRVEYFKIRRLFRGKPDRFFLSLPTAKNPGKVTTMRLMSFTCFTAYALRPNLALLMVFRLLQSALKHGISGPAVVAFASYAYIVSVYMGRIEEGTRFGKLALAFLEQGDGLAWLPRVAFPVHGLVYRTAFPFRDSLEPLRKAYRLALKAGDMEGSMFTAFTFYPLLFHAGTPLGIVEEELRSHTKLMDSLCQQLALTHLIPMWQFICDLIGDVPYPLNLVGNITNASMAFAAAKEKDNKMSLGYFYLYKTIYSCLVGEYEGALKTAKQSRETFRGSEVWLIFFEGFASLAKARNSPVRSVRRKALSAGRKAVKSMKNFCHENFGSKAALLEAEISVLKGKASMAVSFYNLSIELAKEQGFLLETGLAYERLGHFQATLGSNAVAIPYYEAACRTYTHWGARTLVTRMEQHLLARRQSTSQLAW